MKKETYQSPVIISKSEEDNNPDVGTNSLVVVLVAGAVSVAVAASVALAYSAAVVAYAGLVTPKGC